MIAVPWAIAATAILLVGVPAAAAETPAEQLAVRIAADATVVEAVRDRLGPRLAAQSVTVTITPAAAIDIEHVLAATPERGSGAPIARGWVDARAPDAVLLFLVPREADRVLARRIRLQAGVDEVVLAELTYIVERAVASLRASEPIGVPRAEARAAVAAVVPPPVPAPVATVAVAPVVAAPPAPAEPTRGVLGVGAFGGVGAWSSATGAVPLAGLAVSFERVSGSRRFGLALSGELRRSFEVDAQPTDVRVGGGAAHLLLTLGARFGTWGVGRVSLGPGLVIAHVEPLPDSASTGQVVTSRPRTDVDVALRLSPRWDFPLVHGLSIFTAAILDVVPVRADYTAEVAGKQTPLFSAWPVRPGFVVGFAWGAVD